MYMLHVCGLVTSCHVKTTKWHINNKMVSISGLLPLSVSTSGIITCVLVGICSPFFVFSSSCLQRNCCMWVVISLRYEFRLFPYNILNNLISSSKDCASLLFCTLIAVILCLLFYNNYVNILCTGIQFLTCIRNMRFRSTGLAQNVSLFLLS